jgi:DNA-binding transcriptional regulator YiaG
MTYVYVLRAGSGPVKIGRASNPEARRRELSAGCPYRLELVYKHPCKVPAKLVEADTHRMLWEYRTWGEWFEVSAEDAIEAIHQAEQAILNPPERKAPEPQKEEEPAMTDQMVIITPRQSAAARGMLGMTTEDIRTRAGLGHNTITRWEKGHARISVETMEKLVAAYRSFGVEFPDRRTVRLAEDSPQAMAA